MKHTKAGEERRRRGCQVAPSGAVGWVKIVDSPMSLSCQNPGETCTPVDPLPWHLAMSQRLLDRNTFKIGGGVPGLRISRRKRN